MNLRDILTLIGTILTSLGPTLLTVGKSETAFWAGTVCSIVGPILLGNRAVIKDPNAAAKLAAEQTPP